MKEIILPVHPMSRCMLLQESGGIEPLVLRNHDPIFGIFTVRRLRPERISRQITGTLTSYVHIQVDDAIARQCIENAHAIGITLYRLHKDTMCRYIQAGTLNGAPALHALRQFYHLHKISEDDYQEESSWKSWQRWAKTRQKKRHFFAHKNGKPSDQLSKKRAARANLLKPTSNIRWTLQDAVIEMAASRFLSAYAHTFRHMPRRFDKHIRIYLYIKVLGLSTYEAAKKIGFPQTTCSYATRAIEARARKNATVAHLLAESLALPTPA